MPGVNALIGGAKRAAVLAALAVFAHTDGPVLLAEEKLRDFTNVRLESLGIKPVEAKKDPKTGFVVGGKNATAVIQGLTEIAGRSIAALEKDMRPGADSDVGSDKGFLGPDERLLDVLAADNRYVVEKLGLTHQDVARHLHALGAIGRKLKDEEFLYHGRRFQVKIAMFRGYQLSPFRDGTMSNTDATIRNLTSGKSVELSLLVPFMIERYGFYEGKGTPYRVDPARVMEALDFLKKPSPAP